MSINEFYRGVRALGSKGDVMGIRDPVSIESYKGRLITETPKADITSWRRMFVLIITLIVGFFIVGPVFVFYLNWEEVSSWWFLCFPSMFIGAAVITLLLIVPFLMGTGEFAIYDNGIIHNSLASKRTFYPWMSFEGYRLSVWYKERKKVHLFLRDGREFFINPTMPDFGEALEVIEERLVDLGPAESDSLE